MIRNRIFFNRKAQLATPSVTMDNSLHSDGMDWEEDSSLHIIQPASSPWRKRSFDTYNDTNEPYRANEGYSGYQVTDTLRLQNESVEPFIDFNGRPARYVTDFDGNVILQPIIQRQPRKAIGDYLPEFVKWIIYGTALLVLKSCELAGGAYIHTATVAVRVGDSAKRRLVEVTRRTSAPAPPPQRRRHDGPPHRRRSPIIRRVSPKSPGGRTHVPVTPPRARPTATLTEAAVTNHENLADYKSSHIEHERSDGSISSSKNDRLMSGVVHQPVVEPLMSGALQDIELDESAPSNATPSFSPYHIPGTFPDLPAPLGTPSFELPIPESQNSEVLDILHDHITNESAESDEQADDELATPRSEASDEPDVPVVQPTKSFPSQMADSRPRNYKGDLLDEWQIKVCREFQAIHPPPRELQRQATIGPEQPSNPNSTGLIESYRSPMANGSRLSHHQQHGTTTTGLIDSRRSPLANVHPTGTACGTVDPHELSTGLVQQPHGVTSIGSNDLHRSPLDMHKAITESLHQPDRTTSTGSNDFYRSPLADVSPTKAGNVLDDLHNATTDISHQSPGTATIRSTDLRRSDLANVLPINSQHETATRGLIVSKRSLPADVSPAHSPHWTKSLGSIDLPRSPLVDILPIHLQPETSPIGSISSPRSPLAEPLMEAAVDVITDIHEAGANVSDHAFCATPLPSQNSPMNSSANINTATAELPSKWSIRSLYTRFQGKEKKRSPLGERVNNANIHKVPKTPKKVTWPENGPVTGTKRFMKYEAMSHPSPSSSREDSSILSSVPSDLSPQPSPATQEEEEEAASNPPYQTYPPTSAVSDWGVSPGSSNESEICNQSSKSEHTDAIHNSGEEQTTSSSSSSDNEASVQSVKTPTKTTAADPSTPPPNLSPKFEELTISTRRSSLRRREKEDQAQRLRDAIAAEEKARKDKEEAEEKVRKDKEEAEERARIKAEEEEKRKKTGGRRIPIEKVIQKLSPDWNEKIRINMAKGMREQLALTSVGNPLTRRDFGMVLPQPGTGDDPIGWLNDEIIGGYLQAVVDHGHRAMGHPRGAKPRMHAFNPFFYTTLKERGYDAVKRWSARAKIGGNDLKTVEYVFIPCNPSKNHWTLVVVSPVRKTIEVFDSMHGSSVDKVITTKSWLRGELGRSYIDSEWTVVEDPVYRDRGKGPTQNNYSDCGVFAVTTAKMLVLGVDPMAVSAEDMPLQRRRLVAELLNGGFSGEFEPRVVFE